MKWTILVSFSTSMLRSWNCLRSRLQKPLYLCDASRNEFIPSLFYFMASSVLAYCNHHISTNRTIYFDQSQTSHKFTSDQLNSTQGQFQPEHLTVKINSNVNSILTQREGMLSKILSVYVAAVRVRADAPRACQSSPRDT